eukprot:1161785-Pelagomonas_calceolata.AAC.10
MDVAWTFQVPSMLPPLQPACPIAPIDFQADASAQRIGKCCIGNVAREAAFIRAAFIREALCRERCSCVHPPANARSAFRKQHAFGQHSFGKRYIGNVARVCIRLPMHALLSNIAFSTCSGSKLEAATSCVPCTCAGNPEAGGSSSLYGKDAWSSEPRQHSKDCAALAVSSAGSSEAGGSSFLCGRGTEGHEPAALKLEAAASCVEEALKVAALKLEAAASYVEEALKSKEAVEAENAAAAAKAAEDEAVEVECVTTSNAAATAKAAEDEAVARKWGSSRQRAEDKAEESAATGQI